MLEDNHWFWIVRSVLTYYFTVEILTQHLVPNVYCITEYHSYLYVTDFVLFDSNKKSNVSCSLGEPAGVAAVWQPVVSTAGVVIVNQRDDLAMEDEEREVNRLSANSDRHLLSCSPVVDLCK